MEASEDERTIIGGKKTCHVLQNGIRKNLHERSIERRCQVESTQGPSLDRQASVVGASTESRTPRTKQVTLRIS